MANVRPKIKMSPGEVDDFTHQRHTATLCSVNHDGTIHAVAMWYGFAGGRIGFHTKAKSQKTRNLARNPAMTVLIEDGDSYDELRGVELVGRAVIVDDPGQRHELALSVLRRYHEPVPQVTEAMIESSLFNRVVLALDVQRVVSWDHRKMKQALVRG
jgi:PPOX class probable F420-dependent enzyme